jgi:hypothetical protein
MMTTTRIRGSTSSRSVMTVTRRPTSNEPLILMANVAHGNPVWLGRQARSMA